MNIQTIRPPCNLHHDACPCRHWEYMKVLNELNQAQQTIRQLEKDYSELSVRMAESLKDMVLE